MLVPRYLYLWTSSTAWSLTTTEGVTDRCLRKSINTSMIVKNLPKPWKWPASAAEIQRKHQHLLGGQTPWIRASLWQVTNGVIYSADKFVKWYGWSNNYRDRIHVQSLSGEAWAWGIWPFSNHKDERQSSCGRGQRGMMREGLNMRAVSMIHGCIGNDATLWQPLTSSNLRWWSGQIYMRA